MWHSKIAVASALLCAASAEQVQIGKQSDAVQVNALEQARNLGGSKYSTRFPGVTWDNDEWTLTSTTIDAHNFEAMAFTANGYFGSSLSSTGPFVQGFSDSVGWPIFNFRQTFGTISGFFDRQPQTNGSNFPWLYQEGWDSVISGVPCPFPLILELDNGKYLFANTSADELSNVELVQDFKQGWAEWKYTWSPSDSDGVHFNISYAAFAHRLNVNQGYTELSVVPSKDTQVSIVNVIDGMNALRTDFSENGQDGNMIYTAVSPHGVPEVTAWIYSGMTGTPDLDLSQAEMVSDKPYVGKMPSSIAQAVNVTLKAGQTSTFCKHIGIASTDGFQDPKAIAKSASTSSMSMSSSSIKDSHTKEWASEFSKGSVTDFSDPCTGQLPQNAALIEKQIASVVSPFMLLMNTVSENAWNAAGQAPININGISVGGLTSDAYAGQKFWDMDVWMLPRLAATHPFAAKQITNARVALYDQAKKNVKTAFTSSQNQTKFDDDAALYPWTAGRDGNCTATGPCFDYEYHLNGDIVLGFIDTWSGSGDTSYLKDKLLPIMNSISTAYSNLLIKNGSHYELHNLTDPDEYANFKNNGGFTNPLIASTFNTTNDVRSYFGQQPNAEWTEKAMNILIPREDDLSLEYDGMNNSAVVKQADVVLKIFPLDVREDYTTAQQQTDLSYYAQKQSPDGPGMTYAIFSIGANTVLPSGCSAYTYDENSWSPYTRGPWFHFSEQLIDDPTKNGGTNPAFPFLTGHGGFLQVDTFGYLGLRRSTDFYLRVNPSLPPQISHIAHPTIYHHGWPVQVVSNLTHTTMKRSGKPLSTANSTFASNSIMVLLGKDSGEQKQLDLKADGSEIVVANQLNQQNLTTPGDILQCRNVISAPANEPGLFPAGAIDGAESTAWQPASADAARLTVDTSNVPFQPLKEIRFDWAIVPPSRATVMLHNYSDPSAGVAIKVSDIKISQPYDAKDADKFKTYVGNQTTVQLKGQVWSANYVTLEIEGNQGNKSDAAPGATVADFALIGMGSA